jgi:3-dehydroquinate synthase
LKKIRVKLSSNAYNIYIGDGILKNTGTLLRKLIEGNRVMIVSNKNVYSRHGKALKTSLSKYFNVSVHLMPDGEKFKTLKTVEGIYNACAAGRLDRYSAIVALGGGVTGDTAGFAAATYMRGIPVVQVPTSLIAMSDAAIGGKTGVDIPAGKNLVGAFHQPLFVLMDINTLLTLPDEEYRNGLSEVIKHGIILDKRYFNFIKDNRVGILKREKNVVFRMVADSAAIKAGVVVSDEKEKNGKRALLNYGHTIGHAIEAEGGFSEYKHGQAIVLGMIAAANIALKTGFCDEKTVNEQIQVFNSFNLIKPLKNLKTANIIKRLYNDKKARNGQIRFVLTKEIGHAKFIKSVPNTIIKSELEKLYIGEAL